MKQKIINSILAALLIIGFPGFSHAGGHFMGNNATVASEGAIDVTRNPALLLEQPSRNSLGVFGVYIPSSRTDLSSGQLTRIPSGFLMITTTEFLTNLRSAMLYSGTASVSYIRTMGKIALGCSMQYDGEQSRLSGIVTNIMSTGTIAAAVGTVQYTTKINPSLTLSAAYRVVNHGVIGIQIKESYAENIEEQVNMGSSLAPSVLKSTSYTGSREVTTAPAIGYLHHLGLTQLGAMIKLGDVSFREWTTKFTSFDKPLSAASTGQRGEKTLPFNAGYRAAPTLMLGVYTRPIPVFGFSVGADISLPCTYRNPSATYIGPAYKYYIFNFRQSKSATATVKGGMEFHPTKWFTISLGAGYSFSISKSQFNRIVNSFYATRITLETGFLATMGSLEYQFSESIRATVGVTWLRGRFSTESYNNFDMGVNTIKPAQIITTMAVSAGF